MVRYFWQNFRMDKKTDMNVTISDLLDNTLIAIDEDDFSSVVELLREFLTKHPERIDLRATKEIRLNRASTGGVCCCQLWPPSQVAMMLPGGTPQEKEVPTDQIMSMCRPVTVMR